MVAANLRAPHLEGGPGEQIGGEHWTFSLDDGRTEVTTANRLRHITAGQNLATDRACSSPDCTHLLFLAADLEPPADCGEAGVSDT